MTYEHPQYTTVVGRRTAAARRDLDRPDGVRRGVPRLGLPRGRRALRPAGRRVARGDVVTATCRFDAVAVARREADAACCPATPCTATPRIYDTVVTHVRNDAAAQRRSRTRARRGSSTSTRCRCCRSYGRRSLARFDARDHFDGTAPTIRAGLDRGARRRGHRRRRSRVLMLASPRVLGYVFNPLSVYWCHRGDGSLACDRRRGAQHLRRAARLRRRHRRAWPGRGAQGLLRLAVLRHRAAATR